MTTLLSKPGLLPSFDDHGRAIALTEEKIRQRNSVAMAALDALDEIGDEVEQRETLGYQRRVVDVDRLSNRPRFGS
jgi:hypothetical protein